MTKCPKCSSSNTKLVKYLNIETVKCNACGFDESKAYDVFPEQKTSQKAKGSYSKYKAGGSQRAKKKI